MAAGEIVFARVVITIDPNGVTDTSVQQAFATALFPIATYALIHTSLIPHTGTETKATLVVVAQSVA